MDPSEAGVLLDFIRSGKRGGNGLSNPYEGKLRNDCLNTNQFLAIADARSKIEEWRMDTTSTEHIALAATTRPST